MKDKLNFINNKVSKKFSNSPSPFSNGNKERTKTVQVRYSYYKKLKIEAAENDESIVDLLDKCIKHAEEDNII